MSPYPGYRRFKKKPWDLTREGQGEPVKPEDVLRNLGKTVRQLRRQRQMTQEDLAEIAGVNVKHLGEVERGRGNPTLQFLSKIAGALGTELNDFFAAPQEETSSAMAEITAQIRKLDQASVQKLHKILQVIFD